MVTRNRSDSDIKSNGLATATILTLLIAWKVSASAIPLCCCRRVNSRLFLITGDREQLTYCSERVFCVLIMCQFTLIMPKG